jgi:hypothetical protein
LLRPEASGWSADAGEPAKLGQLAVWMVGPHAEAGQPSSTLPSQLLSIESAQTSIDGVPGTQLSTTVPLTHDVDPVAAQAPIPHDVPTET